MKALLVLEDGFTLEGDSFTGEFETGGEVIFSTGMMGYQEILTDPSHHSQMICMTYPLIGNYGITHEDMESDSIHASALIVKECCKEPSNWRSYTSLPEFLQKYSVAGIEHIDTRALTRHLRLCGVMRGRISTQDLDPKSLQAKVLQQPTMQGQNLVQYVAGKTVYTFDTKPEPVTLAKDGSYNWQNKGLPLIVYDFGIKWSLLRLLLQHGFEPLIVPPDFTIEQVKASGAKGVLLSNGPGDPAALTSEIANIKTLIAAQIPLCGICLGQELIALALGAKTEKLKFGHHGANQPVRQYGVDRIEIATQNHGFTVSVPLPEELEVTHINLNDQTIAGLRHKSLPIISLQYLPGSTDPDDSNNIFNKFRDMLKECS